MVFQYSDLNCIWYVVYWLALNKYSQFVDIVHQIPETVIFASYLSIEVLYIKNWVMDVQGFSPGSSNYWSFLREATTPKVPKPLSEFKLCKLQNQAEGPPLPPPKDAKCTVTWWCNDPTPLQEPRGIRKLGGVEECGFESESEPELDDSSSSLLEDSLDLWRDIEAAMASRVLWLDIEAAARSWAVILLVITEEKPTKFILTLESRCMPVMLGGVLRRCSYLKNFV